MSLQPLPLNPPTRPLTRADMRIGDSEREQVCRALSDHFTAGRLSGDEFDERVERAVQARTDGELWHLLADLPAPPAPVTVLATAAPASAAVPAQRVASPFDVLFGLLGLAAGLCLMLLFMASGARFAFFGFFACLGAATVAAAITHLVHRSVQHRDR